MSYKWCAVPECTNTSKKTPNKLFIHVPKKTQMRKKWLQLAWRDPNELSEKSIIYFCQDHFNIEKDMANYYKYTMGFSQNILMQDGVVPSKFYCQENLRKRMSDKFENFEEEADSPVPNTDCIKQEVKEECFFNFDTEDTSVDSQGSWIENSRSVRQKTLVVPSTSGTLTALDGETNLTNILQDPLAIHDFTEFGHSVAAQLNALPLEDAQELQQEIEQIIQKRQLRVLRGRVDETLQQYALRPLRQHEEFALLGHSIGRTHQDRAP